MAQIYKVFANNFFILITDSLVEGNKLMLEKKNRDFKLNLYHTVFSKLELTRYLFDCKYSPQINVIYECKNAFTEFKNIKKEFEFIVAAGGVVQNKKNEVLMIYKNDIWDLPKGKVDLGESIFNTAMREVFEETNVKDLQIVSDQYVTFHIYNFSDLHISKKAILKETKWFLMKTHSCPKLIPQTEEGISMVSWIPVKSISNIKTYDSVRLVLKNFISS